MKSALPCFLLLAAAHAFGQIDLRGIVKDASTGVIIPGAVIQLEGTDLLDTSDENGTFRIFTGPASLYPERPQLHQPGSGTIQARIIRIATARTVAEYSVPASTGGFHRDLSHLPAGLYLIEARTANSVTRRRFTSLGHGTTLAALLAIGPHAAGNPASARTRAIPRALAGSKAGFFPRRQALDTLVKEGVTVGLRRLGSFDGLWIGKTEFQDTLMLAIEGDSLTYVRGPDSLVTDTCVLRRIFEVPSLAFPIPTSGRISNDSLAGGVPVEYPGGRYAFDISAEFASDSAVSGRMDIQVDLPLDPVSMAACSASRIAAWTAAKTPFDTRYDGLWKGIDSKGDSLEFKVLKGRLASYTVDIRLGTYECGRHGDFGIKGLPYWVLPTGNFSFAYWWRESTDTSAFSYRLDGRFSSIQSAAGTALLSYSKASPSPPCDISDSVTWMATRRP